MSLETKVMLVDLDISVFGGKKTDRSVSEDVAAQHNADRHDSGRYEKNIISKHALKEIQNLAGAARREHYARTLPFTHGGGDLIAVKGYMDYCGAMQVLKEKFSDSVRLFEKAYPKLIEEARTRLNGMFNQEDYPPIDQLRSRFSFDIYFRPLPNTQSWALRDIANEEMDILKQAHEQNLQQGIAEAVRVPYQRIASVTEKMVTKLKAYGRDPETGKVISNFHETLISNVEEMAELIPSLNITDDPELDALAERIRTELCKFDAEALKAEPRFREEVADKAQAILDHVSALMG
ncbi:MAG TPA: DUF3150 domain-containing protein [Rhodopila sp.]|nr:DUF3150 domain-containing protein [Rhodopila sp.]